MRRPRTVSLPGLIAQALLAASLLACEPDARATRLRLEPPEALGCQPSALTSLRVEPLGDFPAEMRPSIVIDLEGGAQPVELFPDATERVAVRAEGYVRMGGGTIPWTGGGVATLVEGEVPVPILRLRRSCALSDPEARVPAGAVALALDDGRLLVAGGHVPDGRVLEAVVTVRPGERLAQTGDLRLFNPRTGATGTALPGGLVLIAGGTSAVGGAPFDNAEVLRVTPGEETRLEGAILQRPRRAHGAARLPDGRVLLVGGLDASGRPRADAELVTVGDGGMDVRAELTAGAPVARAHPTVLALDDGSVIVVGGVDGDGEPVGAVERFDPSSGSFEETEAELPARLDAAYAALPGGRVAQLGGRSEDGGWSPRIEVLLEAGARVVELTDEVVPPDLVGADDPEALEAPAAAGLPDGRVLVVGRDPRGGRAAARLIDPGGTRTAGEAEREPLDPSRVATHLVPLADGSIAEGDADGVSLLRLDLSTPFADPAARIFPAQMNQRSEVSMDAPGSWEAEADLLISTRDGARFDLPASRFADVRVELDAEGPVELLLTRDGAAPVVVAIGDSRVSAGDCGVDRSGGPVTVRRAGDRLTLGSEGVLAECAVELEGRVGVAVRAPRGSGIRQISVARL